MIQKKIKAAIVGYGNIGHYTLQALQVSEDFDIVGIVRRDQMDVPHELRPYRVVASVNDLETVDVAIICSPTRLVKQIALEILDRGISTVDSFDIHRDIVALRQVLGEKARERGAVAVIASGWDPGSDSVVRTLMQAIVPKGITYTNFGPGMSMGHTVAVKAVEGVTKALSVTIPVGAGIHRRMVYVELKPGYDAEGVVAAIKADDYFAHDETHVQVVDSVDDYIDMGHGVYMMRKGVSGQTQNQILEFNMKINNPALTAQILVSSARAALRQAPGCYTMQEIPVIDLLPGEREYWIDKLC